MHKLVLYQYPSCPYCRRVLNAIKELKVDVELRNTMTHREHSKALRALMGSTQVPTMLIDDKPMQESADIIDWLYEHYGKGKKKPKSRGWW